MRYKDLVAKAQQAEAAYYVDDSPIMEDAEYDALLAQLAAYEAAFPDQIDPDSPTQRVGGKVSGAFDKVPLPRRMLSLKNIFSVQEAARFIETVNKADPDRRGVAVQYKLDGLTLCCHYKDGRLVQAVTRGDGDVGEDVTATARTIRNLPLVIRSLSDFWARGEVMMSRKEFERQNAALLAEGKTPFANPRNAAAGSLRQKDPAVAASRRLCIMFYDLYPCDELTEMAKLVNLRDAGLPTLFDTTAVFKDADEAFESFFTCTERVRDALSYDIDGLVLKAVSFRVREALGEGNKTPNWAVAYKFPAQHVSTRLKQVTWEVGQSGVLTPVAHLAPVCIGGSMVKKASLHNQNYIDGLQLRIGDKVSLYKAAEIIPQISVVMESNQEGELVQPPATCPVCGAPTAREGVETVCTSPTCKGKIKARLLFWAGRPRMDIHGIGDSVAEALAELISDPMDMYGLTESQLLGLPLFAAKKAENLLKQIEKSKERPFARVLASFGIPQLGETTAATLVASFGTARRLQQATAEELSKVDGIGEATAALLAGWFSGPQFAAMVDKAESIGLHLEGERTAQESDKLAGMRICITGTLSKPRDFFKDLITRNGGIFQSAVNGSTTYLVAGDGGGSKAEKAAKLGVKTIGEEEFYKLLGKE